MYRVTKSVKIGNLNGKVINGIGKGTWNFVKKKVSMFCVITNIFYTVEYNSKEAFESDRLNFQNDFLKGLASIGYDENNKKFKSLKFEVSLPKEKENEPEEEPMTFRKWREMRKNYNILLPIL